MNTVWSFLSTHEVGVVLGVLYALSAMVGALPPPGSPEPFRVLFYKWFFDFIHTALNQVDKVVQSRYPQAHAQITAQTTDVVKSTQVVTLNPVPVPVPVKEAL